MAKDSYWFPHDSNASSDPKMVALVSVYGMAGKGQYWTIIELLREQEGYRYSIEKKFSMSSLADVLKIKLDECEKFIDDLVGHFELLQRNENSIWSDSLLRRMEVWDEKKRKLSERGKAGAAATNAKKSAQADQTPGTSEAKAKEMSGNYRENITEQNITGERENGTHSHFLKKNENSKFSHEQLEVFKSYQAWIDYNTPEVAKMKDPLTIDQFFAFEKKFPAPAGERIFKRILIAMNDRSDLHKSKSAFQTIKRYIAAEKIDQETMELRDRRDATNSKHLKLSAAVREINMEMSNELYDKKMVM